VTAPNGEKEKEVPTTGAYLIDSLPQMKGSHSLHGHAQDGEI